MKLRVSELIKQKGFTIQDIADKINVSRQSLANTLTKGNPTCETLERIAKALNVPVWELFVNPNELNKSVSNTANCPHCNKPIKLS